VRTTYSTSAISKQISHIENLRYHHAFTQLFELYVNKATYLVLTNTVFEDNPKNCYFRLRDLITQCSNEYQLTDKDMMFMNRVYKLVQDNVE